MRCRLSECKHDLRGMFTWPIQARVGTVSMPCLRTRKVRRLRCIYSVLELRLLHGFAPEKRQHLGLQLYIRAFWSSLRPGHTVASFDLLPSCCTIGSRCKRVQYYCLGPISTACSRDSHFQQLLWQCACILERGYEGRGESSRRHN